MTNIPGLKSLLRNVGSFITWTYNRFFEPDSGQFLYGPITTFLDFIQDYAVVFIFVVVVPLVGLGISLLRRMLDS